MLEPVKHLVYFYYKCSKCGEIGSEVRLSEVKRSNPTHVCPYCENIDDLKQVSGISINYGDSNKSKMITVHVNNDDTKIAKTRLIAIGCSNSEAKVYLQRALVHHKPTNADDLFNKAVLEMERYEQSKAEIS